MQDYEWRLGSGEFDNDWDLVTPSYKSPLPIEVEDRGIVDVIAHPTILCLATLESASLAMCGPKMKNSTTLSFLSMLKMKMMRKYVGQLKLNHSECFGTAGSNKLSCLVRSFIGM